jgi:capsular polysaccharide export protein
VPPFPGSRSSTFAVSPRAERTDAEVENAILALATRRVGGTYWGTRPLLAAKDYVLVSVRDLKVRARVIEALPAGQSVVGWSGSPQRIAWTATGRIEWAFGLCDPWHLVDEAKEIVADADSDLAIVAVLAGRRTTIITEGSKKETIEGPAARCTFLKRSRALDFDYANPFTGEAIPLHEAIELCAFWRDLIDSNRPIVAALGFASWKRRTVAPLLWSGGSGTRFTTSVTGIGAGAEVAIWRTRIAAELLKDLECRKAHLVEVEDGFIRSIGLGAECVPPLSIVVDHRGIYFDPSRPSELEGLIERGGFDPRIIDRARALRALIVEQGISKYGASQVRINRRCDERRQILVVGQVEDDRSVMTGGGEVRTNLELLRRVRAGAPDAHIIYKPHPDVVAGHRVGAIPPSDALRLANEVIDHQPIGSLIDVVDEVHVNTSLAGFEALLRDRAVVTHGMPFYAGWGLTTDLGTRPPSRTATRTIDELIAAVLLLYPRYLDPVTGLPCPPEILIRRLTSADASGEGGMLIPLRRLQGRLKRGLTRLGGWRWI